MLRKEIVFKNDEFWLASAYHNQFSDKNMLRKEIILKNEELWLMQKLWLLHNILNFVKRTW